MFAVRSQLNIQVLANVKLPLEGIAGFHLNCYESTNLARCIYVLNDSLDRCGAETSAAQFRRHEELPYLTC